MGLGLGLHGQRFHGGTTGGPPWRMVLDSEPVALEAGSDGARINALNPYDRFDNYLNLYLSFWVFL